MEWIIAAIVIWAIAPFLPLLLSLITFLIKWIGLFICFIIDCFRR